jgi:hypothetical protein
MANAWLGMAFHEVFRAIMDLRLSVTFCTMDFQGYCCQKCAGSNGQHANMCEQRAKRRIILRSRRPPLLRRQGLLVAPTLATSVSTLNSLMRCSKNNMHCTL